MPSAKPGPALFLGIELGIDQLRASIVDESLDLVGVECIDFDSDLPEYQYVRFNASWRLLTSYRTQGGIFTTPGEAYTTPVEMWLKGLGEHLCPASICAARGSCTVCPAPGFFCPWVAPSGTSDGLGIHFPASVRDLLPRGARSVPYARNYFFVFGAPCPIWHRCGSPAQGRQRLVTRLVLRRLRARVLSSSS